MTPVDFNWMDFLLNVAGLAIVPGVVALFGGILAAEGLEDLKRRRIKGLFWFLFVVGVAITAVQQYRIILADQGRPSSFVAAFREAFPWFKPPQETPIKLRTPKPTPPRQRQSNDDLRSQVRDVTDHLRTKEQEYIEAKLKEEFATRIGNKSDIAAAQSKINSIGSDAEYRNLCTEANYLWDRISTIEGNSQEQEKAFCKEYPNSVSPMKLNQLREMALKLPL